MRSKNNRVYFTESGPMTNTDQIPEKKGILITIGMQKGGVAKSTNATHLAAALGERGKRVLL